MKLFESLQTYNRMQDFIPFLDWIFPDDKFPDAIWKHRIGSYAKKVKRFDGISDKKNFFYDAQKNLDFPKKDAYKNLTPPQVYMSSGSSIARDWLRHIRNGLAHGNNQVIEKDGKLYIELLDFSDEAHKNQTAYLFMPLDFLLQSLKVYREKEKAIKEGKSKEKKKRK